MAPDVLEADGLVAGYGRLDVLHGVSLRLAQGELLAVLGANGAGKSTVLKALLGLADVRSGSVRLDGKDVTDWPTERRVRAGMGYVPQLRNVFPHLTVAENLAMGAFAGPGDPGLVQRLFPMLEPLGDRRAGTLSGGQRQVLALARALAGGPKALLLDEPTAGLAPQLVVSTLTQVRALAQEVPVLLVEQNARRAVEVADRVLVLQDGRERFAGRSDELRGDRHLADLFLGQAT